MHNVLALRLAAFVRKSNPKSVLVGALLFCLITLLPIAGAAANGAGDQTGSLALAPPADRAAYLAAHEARMARLQQEQNNREEPDPAQANYDARTYVLDLALDPTAHILTGTVTVRATVVEGPLTECVLDLEEGMSVANVTSGGSPTTFTHIGRLLTVALDRAYDNGEDFVLAIQYSGDPAGSSFAWDSHAEQTLIWTLSEPFGARAWWPCKDYPEDKADSVDIKVTVPSGLITVSNGRLLEETDDGSTAFTWWREHFPIATYLVFLAIHPYHVYSDWYQYAPDDSMEIRFYNFTSSIPEVEEAQARVKDMIAAFAARFGEYPFVEEKYGHAEFTWPGGMEHQTCSSMGGFPEWLICHELAHQWWGDWVTCQDFHHVWLSEGFATYSEALWAEAEGGMTAYHANLNAIRYLGPGTIYVPTIDDFNRIFDYNLSYNKAAWVLHMLRGVLGDDTFFQTLRTYGDQYRYSKATTEDFQSVAETVSGQDLSAFFQQWIYGERIPVYEYSWTATPSGEGYDIFLNLQQVQTWQLFTMPIPIVVTTTEGTQAFRVQNSQADQNYVLHADAEPTALTVDPDNWILREVMPSFPQPTFTNDLLVINGVDWASSVGPEIRAAYDAKSVTGDYPFDFWDCFNTPPEGYPSSLPPVLGHGTIPGDVLGRYKNVIWIGNYQNGDQNCWNGTPVYSYLVAGGNLFLMTKSAYLYLNGLYWDYLGVTWFSEGFVTDCIATYPGLTDIGRIGVMGNTTAFDVAMVGQESTLLYKAVSGHDPNWGLGVIRQPPAGGTYNPNGAKFMFLSGRPYRWDHTDLRTNINTLLSCFFGLVSTGVQEPESAESLLLQTAGPNPFHDQAMLRFTVPASGVARLFVCDVTGRRIRTLLEGSDHAGPELVRWDGRDDSGRDVSSGIYYVRLESNGARLKQKLVRVR